MTIDPLYVASGLAVGALVGMTGVGGGSLMTPLLVLLFGIQPATAVGTDLLYAAVTKTAGSAVHGSKGGIAWRVVGLLAAGSLPAAALTLYGLRRLGAPSSSVSNLISIVLGATLLLTAVSLLLRRRLMAWASREGRGSLPPGARAALTVGTGFILGVLVSISSVGAGAIGVTALVLLYPGLPTMRVVGTDLAHAVPLTLVAGLGHWWIGSVDGAILGSLLLGSLPGVVMGSLVASRIPEAALRLAMTAVLAVAGGQLLMKSQSRAEAVAVTVGGSTR